MKFWAKVRLTGEKNAEYLIRAFFQNFNPASSIVIKDNEAKLEIYFNEPSMEIIEAMHNCQVLEFYYGRNLAEYKEDEQVKSDEDSEQFEQLKIGDESFEYTEQANLECEISEQNEQKSAEDKSPKQAKQKSVKDENSNQTKHVEKSKRRKGKSSNKKETVKEVMQKPELMHIPKLNELVQQANSFDHFVKLVAEWLEMDKRQKFFEDLVLAATEIDKISWKELEKTLKDNGVVYSDWDRLWSSQQVSAKLKDYSVTMLPFLNIIRNYKVYFLIKKAVGNVDKTKPIEGRVRCVLNVMGLYQQPVNEQKQIFEIANIAVRKRKMDLDTIFMEAKIPTEETMAARMTFSKFVNDFIKRCGSEKKVKLLNFLLQLQNIIMLESEIKNSSET